MSNRIDDEDLNVIVSRAHPQAYGCARYEGGTGIMRMGARAAITNPREAWYTLDERGLRTLGRAMIARGQEYGSAGERLLEMAEAKARGDTKPPGDNEPLR